MINIYHFSTGHDFLENLFIFFSQGRTSYSYNAFARELKIGAASLHRFLNRERSLSNKTLDKISEVMNFSVEEKDYLKKIFQIVPISDDLKLNQKKFLFEKVDLNPQDDAIIHEVIKFLNFLEKHKRTQFTKDEAFPSNVIRFMIKHKLARPIDDFSYELLNPDKSVTLNIGHKIESSYASHYQLILYEVINHLKLQGPINRGVGSELLLFDDKTFLEAKESLNSFLDNLILISKKSTNPTISAQCFSVIYKKD